MTGGLTQIQLPFGQLARSAPVAVAVCVGQTAALVVLVVAWLLVVAGRVRGPA